jgi:hypothetical protein
MDRDGAPHGGNLVFTRAGPIPSLDGRPKPPARHQAHRGDEGARSKHRARNLGQGRCSDRERRSLSPEGPGAKAFGSNVRDARFPQHFQVPNNIIKYDSKTNPSVWLED